MGMTKRRRLCCRADRIQKTGTSDGNTTSPAASHPKNESAVGDRMVVLVMVGERRAELGAGRGDLALASRACHSHRQRGAATPPQQTRTEKHETESNNGRQMQGNRTVSGIEAAEVVSLPTSGLLVMAFSSSGLLLGACYRQIFSLRRPSPKE
jgi:hypothetical protein